MPMSNVKSKSYTLKDSQGYWLGQIVLTTDGMFASVTDYGNLSFAWRSFGDSDFRQFMATINTEYFATKLSSGMAYILHDKKTQQACNIFSKKILPALQAELTRELKEGIDW